MWILTEHLLSLVSFLIYSGFRSSRSQMFFKIVTLKNFSIFTGKYLCWKFIKNTGKAAALESSLLELQISVVFMWILQNFWEHLFCKTEVNCCFIKPCLLLNSIEQFPEFKSDDVQSIIFAHKIGNAYNSENTKFYQKQSPKGVQVCNLI